LIPKPLSEIDWTDIEQLVEVGRAEDDTIEFKRSFKGGDDYATFSDSGREQALNAIAREVLAFLNTRGGDVLIGVAEADGPNPSAQEITPIQNPGDAAERIARGLAALIEPAQTDIHIRGILDPQDRNRGIVVARVRASIRAPHRSRRTLECYARRGPESVPMAMDEIQDLTVNRTRLRLEQLDLLDRQFADFVAGKVETRRFGDRAFHIRCVEFPLVSQSIEVNDELLNELRNRNPVFYDDTGRQRQSTVAYRNLYSRWRPILRGFKQENFEERADNSVNYFQYARKTIQESGIAVFDYAQLSDLNGNPGIYSEWIIGYLAEVCTALRSLIGNQPNILPCIVRVGIRATEGISVAYPTTHGDDIQTMPADHVFLPDFPISTATDLDGFFQQAQIDFFSLFNVSVEHPCSLEPVAKEAAAS
jgi:hypothetical protein